MPANKKLNPTQLRLLKESGQKLSMITCYDYSFACIINQTDIDLILVGDSGVMVANDSHDGNFSFLQTKKAKTCISLVSMFFVRQKH